MAEVGMTGTKLQVAFCSRLGIVSVDRTLLHFDNQYSSDLIRDEYFGSSISLMVHLFSSVIYFWPCIWLLLGGYRDSWLDDCVVDRMNSHGQPNR